MTQDFENGEQNRQFTALPHFGIDRLFKYLKPYKKQFIIMVSFGLLGSLIDILLPQFQRYALNEYIGKSTLHGLWLFTLLYFLALVVQVISNCVSTFRASLIELSVNRDLKRVSFNHLQTLSFSYFNQNSVGYIHSRVMSDTSKMGELVSWNVMDGVWNISYIVGALAVMLMMNYRLALMVAVIVPVAALLVGLFQKRLVKINRRIRELNSRISGNFNEGITGAGTVKSLVIEDKMDKSFWLDAKKMKKSSVRATHYRALFGATVSFASSVALAIVLWYGGIITLEGVILIGELSVFMSYALGIMEPIRWIVDAISNLIAVQVNIERFTRLVETQSEVYDTPKVIEKYGDTFNAKRENWEELNGDIEFDDVTFRYPDGDTNVLTHFNLKVPKGTTVAVVGETGAGKSTLVNLVCRFFEPTSGRVLIDGKDARERSILWLHSNIGYVLQTPFLFTGTVRENLLYGNPKATDEEIYSALEKVSARKIVDKMEKGLDSLVGEGGDMLSTGEKQLISFARALLCNPKILILDEATSSVDTITELAIRKATSLLTKGRTSFIIAHRLSTIRNADVILAVKDGEILESGTHDELMSKKGYYYTLYTRQFEEDAVKKI